VNNVIGLSFDEIVDPLTVQVNGLQLQNGAPGSNSLSLSGATLQSGPMPSDTVSILLSSTQIDAIQVGGMIAYSMATTYLSVSGGAIQDMATNPLNEIQPAQALLTSSFVSNALGAQIVNFVLDMQAGTLSIGFDKSIISSTADATKFLLQNALVPTAQFRLTGGTLSNFNSNTLLITLLPADLNSIKALSPNLATSPANTYLTASASAVQDAFSKPSLVLSTAIIATNVILETIRPSLLSFDLDMTLLRLSLTFSEPVKGTSFSVQGLTLQATNDIANSNSKVFTFPAMSTSSLTSSVNALVLIVQISNVDGNALKALGVVATSKPSTYLSVSDSTVTDTNSNLVNVISSANAQLVLNFVEDNGRPSVSSFSLNTNSNELKLTFSETIKQVSFTTLGFTIQNLAAGASLSYPLTGFSSISFPTVDSATIVLLPLDVNAIKTLVSLAVSAATTFLAIDASTTISDNRGNLLNTGVKSTLAYTPDTTAPTLNNFDFDLNAKTLTLVFSEPILVPSFMVNTLTLRASTGVSGTTLTGSTSVQVSVPTDSSTLVVGLVDSDLNALKYNGIALTSATTYLSVVSGTVKDTALASNLLTAGTSLVRTYQGDTVSPTISRVDLNIDTSTLVLTFSETVLSGSVTPQGFTIQSEATSNTGVGYQLQGGSTTQTAQTIVTITLTTADVRAIKLLPPLATARTYAYVAWTSGAALDTSNRMVIAGTLQATLFTEDVTSPQLSSFDLNMNTGLLTLHFNEPVAWASVKPNMIRLQSTSNSASTFFALSGGSVSQVNGLDIVVTLTPVDFDGLRVVAGLCKSTGTTFLTAPATAAQDMIGRPLTAILSSAALPVLSFIADNTEPSLVSFVLDLNQGTLELLFSEPVNPSLAVPIKFAIQNLGVSDVLQLTGGTVTVPNSSEPRKVRLAFVATDLNAIKLDDNLGVTVSGSSLALQSGAIFDFALAPNPSTLLATLDPLSIVPDTIAPVLSSFAVDLNLKRFTFNFNEPVRASTLMAAQLTVQSTSLGGNSYTLTAGTTLSANGLQIIMSINSANLNAITALRPLYSDIDTSFISVTSLFISDMSGVGLAPVSGLKASAFNNNQGKPSLNSFSFNLNSKLLTLTFSETVDPSTLTIASRIALQQSGSALGPGIYALTAFFSKSTSLSTIVTITLVDSDIDMLKIGRIALTDATTWLTIQADSITNIAGNGNIGAVDDANAILVNGYVGWSTPPTLASFNLNVGTSTLTLTFSEPVYVNTLTVAGISLSNAGSGASVTRTLNAGLSSSTSSDGRIVSIVLTGDDSNAVKDQDGFAKDKATTYLSIDPSAIMDITGLSVVAATLQVTTFTPDGVAPVLVGFSLNANHRHTLTLTFSESVLPGSLAFIGFKIQKGLADISSVFQLSSSATVVSSSSFHTIIGVQLSLQDANALQVIGDLAIDKPSSWLSLAAGAVTDTNNQAILQTPVLQAQTYVLDAVNPVLEAFDLNVDSGILTLSFSKTVRANTLTATSITLQNLPSASSSFVLTGGAQSSVNGPVLTIGLTTNDLNSIKALFPLCSDPDSCYVTVPSGFVRDMRTNPANAIVDTAALKAKTVILDVQAPTLTSFTLNLDTAVATFLFSETVKVSSFSVGGITFQSSANIASGSLTPTNSYTLTDSTVTTATFGATAITVKLSTTDLNKLKLAPAIAITSQGTFVSLASSTVTDVNLNAVTAIASTSAKASASFTADATPPVLSGSSINMATGVIGLTFSEPVQASSLVIPSIRIQSAQTAIGSNFVTLSGSSTGSLTNGLVLTVTLSPADLNAIKLITSLARNTTTTYFVLAADTVKDMSSVGILAVTNGNAKQAVMFTPDNLPPILLSFDFDVNTGALDLFFDEIVAINTLHRDFFTLEGAQPSDGINKFQLNSN